MEIKGRITQILPEQGGQSKSGSTWRKQDYILETLTEHPKKVCFSVWGEKIDQYKMQNGDAVTAHFDIESREFNGRWYTDIKAWKIEIGINDANCLPSVNTG
jgi:hypothetical protein